MENHPADPPGEAPVPGLPQALRDRAEAILAGDAAWEIPPLADAATVILLRQTPAGPEVFLQRRVGSMKFAAGMYVFPGGKVEETDTTATVLWEPGPREEPFELSPGTKTTGRYRPLATAAVRETWEEARVLLAQLSPGTRPPAGDEILDDELLSWLGTQGATIRATDLRPWAHWLTPEIERRRFDTRFLITEIPAGQDAADLGIESQESLWIRPSQALDRVSAGTMPMLPPTVDALQQLTAFDEVGTILADAETRTPTPLLPRPVRDRSGGIEWVLAHAYSGEILKRW